MSLESVLSWSTTLLAGKLTLRPATWRLPERRASQSVLSAVAVPVYITLICRRAHSRPASTYIGVVAVVVRTWTSVPGGRGGCGASWRANEREREREGARERVVPRVMGPLCRTGIMPATVIVLIMNGMACQQPDRESVGGRGQEYDCEDGGGGGWHQQHWRWAWDWQAQRRKRVRSETSKQQVAVAARGRGRVGTGWRAGGLGSEC